MILGIVLWVLAIMFSVHEARVIRWPRWVKYPGLLGFLIGCFGHLLGAFILFLVREIQTGAIMVPPPQSQA
jgi:uncharacterized membrane protein